MNLDQQRKIVLFCIVAAGIFEIYFAYIMDSVLVLLAGMFTFVTGSLVLLFDIQGHRQWRANIFTLCCCEILLHIDAAILMVEYLLCGTE